MFLYSFNHYNITFEEQKKMMSARINPKGGQWNIKQPVVLRSYDMDTLLNKVVKTIMEKIKKQFAVLIFIFITI